MNQSAQQADLRFAHQASESILLGSDANSQVAFLEGKRKKEEDHKVKLAQTSAKAKSTE